MTFLPSTFLPSEDAQAISGRTAEQLGEDLAPFIGERAVSLFSYAIADAGNSQVTSVFFRRVLIDNGEDPDHPQVTETEQLLIDWGRTIASDPGSITDDFYTRLEAAFSPRLRLLLVAYASQLVAASVFATVGRVPLDDALYPYRKPEDQPGD